MSTEYRALVYRIAKHLREQDRRDLCYVYDLPESCQKSGPNVCYLEPFQELERKGVFSPSNIAGLRKVLEQIERHDLIEEVNEYRRPRTAAQVTASGALAAVSEARRPCHCAETQNTIIASHVLRLREIIQRRVQPVSDLEESIQELEMAVNHQSVLLSSGAGGCGGVARCLRCELSCHSSAVPLALPAPAAALMSVGSASLCHPCTLLDPVAQQAEQCCCDGHFSDGITHPTSLPRAVDNPHRYKIRRAASVELPTKSEQSVNAKVGMLMNKTRSQSRIPKPLSNQHHKNYKVTRVSGHSSDTATRGESTPQCTGRRPPDHTHSSPDSRHKSRPAQQVCDRRPSYARENDKAQQRLYADTELRSQIPKPVLRCATPPQRKGRILPPHHVSKKHQSLHETTSDYYSESDLTGGSECTGSCSSGSKEGGLHAWRSHKLVHCNKQSAGTVTVKYYGII